MSIRKYIGDRDFYFEVLRIAIPLALSQLLVHASSLIDSIMISSIGSVTAVGNANNIVNLYHYIMYGVEAGACLFAAQFFGAKQYKNMAKTQGVYITLNMFNALFWIFSVYLFGDKLLLFYLNDVSVMNESLKYIRIVSISFIFVTIGRSFRCQYQSMHRARINFVDSLCYIIISLTSKCLCLYVFDLGIKGLGYANLFTEIICTTGIIIYSLKDKPVFLFGLKEMFAFDLKFVKSLLEKMLPCAFNETLFGIGETLFNKAYGMASPNSMEAVYIATDILSLMMFMVWGYGDSVSVLVGSNLGKRHIEEAKKESKYHLGLSFMIGLVLGFFLFVCGPLILNIYSITDISVYNEARALLNVYAIKMFIRTFTYPMFCTLKAGGDSKTFNMLDSGIKYAVGLPLAFLLVKFGMHNVVLLILICQFEQVVRFFLTLKRYNSFKWANNLTESV